MTTPAPIFLSSPATIAEAAPYLLGYNPVERLILIGMKGRQVGPMASLPIRAEHDGNRELLATMAERMLTMVTAQDGVTQLMIVVFSQHQLLGLATHLQVQADQRTLPVVDLVYVQDGRAVSLLDTEPPQPVDLTQTSVDLAVHVGPVGDRSQLIDALTEAPMTGAEELELRAGLLAAVPRVAVDAAAMHAELEAWLLASSETTLTEAGTMIAGLRDTVVRDAAMLRLLDPEEREHVASRCAWLAQVARGPLRSGPITMWAVAAYLSGNAAAAGMALDTVLKVEPDYTMAQLLKASLNSAIPPKDVRDLLEVAGAQSRAFLG